MDLENMGFEGVDFTPEPEDADLGSPAEEIEEEVENTQTGENDEKEQTQDPAAADQGAAPQEDLLEIVYNGEPKKLTRAEAVALAQKGMNYDKIKEENDRRGSAVKLLENLARSVNQPLDEYIKTLSARIEKADADKRIKDIMTEHGCNEETARLIDSLKQDHRREMESFGDVKDKLSQLTAEREAIRIWSEFAKDHSEYTNYNDLPEEVRLAVKNGKTLEDAFNAYEVRQLREQLARGEQQKKNKQKAPGSVKDSGTSAAETDPFMKGFLGNF